MGADTHFYSDLSPEETHPHPTPSEEKGHSISNKINFISSKLTKMTPKARGVIQAWLQRSTNKSAFKTRTAQLIRILSSPSKTAQLMNRLHADAEESSDSEESSEAEDSQAEESSGAEYSDGEESSDADDSHSYSESEMSQDSEKIDYISSKLMNMSPKIRGVVQGWLQRSTCKKAFQDRTRQLIRVLRSPSKTTELMQCLQTGPAKTSPAERPTSEVEQTTVGFITKGAGCIENSKRRLLDRQCSNELLEMPDEQPTETSEEPTLTLEEPSTTMPEEPTIESSDSEDHASLYGWEAETLEEPTTETPEEPTTVMPEEPTMTTETAEEPTIEMPEEPTTEKPKEPPIEKSEEPTIEKSEEPTTEKPEEPTTEASAEPSEPDNTLMITVGVGCLIAGVSYLLYKKYKRSR